MLQPHPLLAHALSSHDKVPKFLHCTHTFVWLLSSNSLVIFPQLEAGTSIWYGSLPGGKTTDSAFGFGTTGKENGRTTCLMQI
jgi:hypothetical protein